MGPPDHPMSRRASEIPLRVLGRRTSFASAALLVAGLLAVATPAHAEGQLSWQFEDRPAGLPASDDPALTLAAASAVLLQDETGRFYATVVLGADPDESTGTAVRIALGHVSGDTCATDWEQTLPTYQPGGPASRDGSTITVDEAIGAADYADGCGSVSLVALADGRVLDRLDAPSVVNVVADHAGKATVTAVSNRSVTPGRPATVWLHVRYRGTGSADGVVVSGTGAAVIVRKRVHQVALEDGDDVWLPVQVRLLSRRAQRVTFEARPYGDLVRADAGPMTVRLKPTR
jgi:hypothetical protein